MRADALWLGWFIAVSCGGFSLGGCGTVSSDLHVRGQYTAGALFEDWRIGVDLVLAPRAQRKETTQASIDTASTTTVVP